MWAASQRAVSGPASTPVLAAGGGLEVPGRETDAAAALAATPGSRRTEERIPGEREPDTLTHREPGAVSGQFAGADIPDTPPQDWLGDRTALDREREGGGVLSRKERRDERQR